VVQINGGAIALLGHFLEGDLFFEMGGDRFLLFQFSGGAIALLGYFLRGDRFSVFIEFRSKKERYT